MNLLAIDSAADILSVALSCGDEIFYAQAAEGMRQSELVMDLIDSLFKKASLEPCDLNGVLCMGGPGSFTGLRIGYSVAKGLALSLSIPFAAIPTLDCIAYQRTKNKEQRIENREQSTMNKEQRIENNEQRTEKCEPLSNSQLLLAVIQARKNAWFYAFFRGEERLTPDRDADSIQISGELNKFREQIILTGPGSALLYESFPEETKNRIIIMEENKGYAGEIINIAKKRNIPDNDDIAYLYSGPEYIRKTDAEINLEEKAGV